MSWLKPIIFPLELYEKVVVIIGVVVYKISLLYFLSRSIK